MGSSVHSPKNQNLLFSLINILLLFFMGRTFLLSSLPLACSSVPIQAGQFWWCFISCIAVALPAVQSKLLPFHLLHLAWQFSFPVTSRNQRQVFTWNSSQNLWGPVLLKSHAKPNDNYLIFFFFLRGAILQHLPIHKGISPFSSDRWWLKKQLQHYYSWNIKDTYFPTCSTILKLLLQNKFLTDSFQYHF